MDSEPLIIITAAIAVYLLIVMVIIKWRSADRLEERRRDNEYRIISSLSEYLYQLEAKKLEGCGNVVNATNGQPDRQTIMRQLLKMRIDNLENLMKKSSAKDADELKKQLTVLADEYNSILQELSDDKVDKTKTKQNTNKK